MGRTILLAAIAGAVTAVVMYAVIRLVTGTPPDTAVVAGAAGGVAAVVTVRARKREG